MLDGYSPPAVLARGTPFVLGRTVRRDDGGSFLIATPSPEWRHDRALRALVSRELELASRFKLPAIARALDVVSSDEDYGLILEDRRDVPLSLVLEPRGLDVRLWIRIAKGIAASLSALERAAIVHRNLQPANILVDVETDAVRFCGLALCSTLRREQAGDSRTSRFGNPLYTAPEQSGRLNRSIDTRTDLYALGCVLYEMLTGRPPFAGAGVAELVHAHVAQTPQSPVEFVPGVPSMVSQIVLKLLSKAPEDRYGSAASLQHDLDRCQEALERGARIGPFPLDERRDLSELLRSEQLVGRDLQFGRLSTLFEAVRSDGRMRTVVIDGPAGTGKTHLVEEMRRAVWLAGGVFARGRHTVAGPMRAFEAVSQALTELVQHHAEMRTHIRDETRQRLAAIDADLALLSGLVPNLSLVASSPPRPAGGEEAVNQHRIHRAVGELLDCLVTAKRPLFLLLDDLHWTDPATLELLEALAGRPSSYILLVVTTRQDPTPEGVQRFFDRLGAHIPVDRLTLEPFDTALTAELVATLLRADVAGVKPIADEVFAASGGNPLLIKTTLRLLEQRGELFWDATGGWIRARPHGDRSREPLDALLRALPSAEREVLETLGVLGALEDELIPVVAALPTQDADACLARLSQIGLLRARNGRVACAHDRIRDVARARVDHSRQVMLHLRVARSLAAHDLSDTGRLFDVIDHYGQAIGLVTDVDERLRVAALHLEATRRASAVGAFAGAYELSAAGLAWLPHDSWHTAHALTLALQNEAADAAALTGRLDEAERLTNGALAKATTLVDALPALETRLTIDSARGSGDEGMAIALAAIKRWGFHLAGDGAQDFLEALGQICNALAPRLASDPATLPAITDPALAAVMRLSARMLEPAMWANGGLFVRLAVAMTEFTLRHGVTPESALAIVGVGAIRCRFLQDFDGGRQTAAFGLALHERSSSSRWAVPVGSWWIGGVEAWHQPHHQLVTLFTENYRLALRAGDWTASITAMLRCEAALHAGVRLPVLDVWLRQHRTEMDRTGHAPAMAELDRLTRVVGSLQDPALQPPAEAGERVIFRQSALCDAVMKAVIWRERTSDVLTIDRSGRALAEMWLGYVPLEFWVALNLLDQGIAREAASHIDLIKARMTTRAHVCPEANQHKLDLLDARLLGDTSEAALLYDRAIAGARRHGYVHEAALACELASELHREAANQERAAEYLRQAANAYREWGAHAKAVAVEREHAALLGHPAMVQSRQVSAGGPAHPSTPHDLDHESIERAVLAVATESTLESLEGRLLEIVAQYAGAERGYFFRGTDDDLVVYAGVSMTGDPAARPGARVAELEDVCQSLIQQVTRIDQPSVVGDASQHEHCAADPYVVRVRPKSILCAPVHYRGQREAILYLEHRRVAGAFQPQRLATVQLMCTHAASASLHTSLSLDLARAREARQQSETDLRRALNTVEALEHTVEADELIRREAIGDHEAFEELIGASSALQAVVRRVKQVAGTAATVLIEGETGTGKELVAKAIHRHSKRLDRPFVKINCAALPPTLIESELFGHERGAFTGAVARKPGRFELADGGTLFLDEIGEIPLDLQGKLLRVLQEREFERIGSTRTLKVDVRVIAATNRNLDEDVNDGRFRDDLYYRLKVFPIVVPPLRARVEDIPLLVWHFVSKHQARLGRHITGVSRGVMDALTRQSWPGNVRELEHVIERALISSEGSTLSLEDIPDLGVRAVAPEAPASAQSLQAIERTHIIRVLDECGWKLKGTGNAAARLGLKPSTLRSRMKKLAISRDQRARAGAAS